MATEKVLIVDDSPIEAQVASRLLTGAGYTTTIVHDSEKVLGVARDWHPDLILLNIVMPKLDGYQICQQLKADPQMRHVAVALYTIHKELMDGLRGIEVGADDFIIKQSNCDDLPGRVKKILAERRMGSSESWEFLNLTLAQLRAEKDSRELADLLFNAFNKHVREQMNVALSAYVAGVLVSRAIEKAAVRFPLFPGLVQAHTFGLLFDSPAVEGISIRDVIEGFRIFSHEVYQLAARLTRAHINGAREIRAIDKAFTDMIKELRVRCQELQNQAGEPVPLIEPLLTPSGGPEISPTTHQTCERENEQLRRTLHDC
ncbi:MAG: response regulator [Acidobacteria bacterium]|nr:response regulator [Acidobacteriota bacterium]